MTIHNQIEDLKAQIRTLTDQERAENIQILIPIIRENCIFEMSWPHHLIRCDRSMDVAFRKKLQEFTVNDYQQFYFGDGVYISWRGGCLDVTSGNGFDYTCSDSEYFLPLILKCKELKLKIDFSSIDAELLKKRNDVQFEMDVLATLKQSYE